MKILIACLAGLVTGLIAAAIWASITYFLKVEVGYVAIGVGFVVGLAMSFASREGSPLLGVLAALISILAILGGKYLAVELLVRKEFAAVVDAAPTNEVMIQSIAIDMSDKGQGEPELNDDGEAKIAPEILEQATAQWKALDETQQQARRDEFQRVVNEGIADVRDATVLEALKQSFGPFDILWGILAIAAAFSAARTNVGEST
jgi:hypothetical protein